MKSDTPPKVEEKYRDLFEKSKDAILIIHNGIFTDCNQATIDLFKYNNKTEILNMHPGKLSPKKQPDGEISFAKANEMMEIALKNSGHRFEWYHKKSDGEIFPVEVSLTALSNTENDQILYVNLRDITDRKQLEIELKESENKYRKLIETTADGFWLNNSENITTLVNQSLCKMLGYSENEIIGKSPMDFVDIKNKEIFEKQILKSKSTSHRTYEILLTRKNGTVFPALFGATSIVDKDEKLKGSFAFITDITELKKAEKIFEKLSSAVKQSPSVIVITDLKGNLEYMNPKFTELTGYTSEEAMGQNPRILKSGELPDKIYKELWDTISSGKAWRGEFHNKKKNGELFWEAAAISPIFDKQGKITNYLKVAEDITEHKKIEKKLMESEERFRFLTTNTSDTIWTTDLEFNLTYVNESIYSFLGYTQEEFIGLNPGKFTTPEGLKKIKEMAKNVVSNSRPNEIKHTRIEVRQIRKDGQIIDVEISANAIFNEDGDIIGFQGRSIDISDRKKMQKILIESEEKYRLIVDNAHDGIEITQNNKIIFSNARFAEMLGYSVDELKNTPFNKIFSKQAIRDLFDRQSRRKTNKLMSHQYETTLIKKNGNIIDVDIKYEIIDYKNQPATFAIIRDITEHKLSEIRIKENSINLEKEFRKSEKQRIANLVVLNDLNKTTKSLHLEIDERRRTEKIQTVLYNISNAVLSSESLEKLIGRIREELGTIIDTKNFYVALYDDKTDILSFPFYADEKSIIKSAPAEKTLTKYVIETKKSLLANLDVKKRFVREGKLIHQGSLSKIWLGVPLVTKEKVIGVFAVQNYTDENAYNELDMKMLEFVSEQISRSIERKRTYETIIAALKKATESDRLKSAFLANMSHEIRTPMNGILGFTGLLKNPQLSGEKQKKYISIIEKSGNRLLNTINDLMDISKIEAGQIAIDISKTNINNKMEDLYNFFKPQFDEKGLRFSFTNTLSIENVSINTDPEKFYAILTNLIKNAFKYTHKGSIEFGYNIKDNDLEFFVKDTGIGISTDRQSAIFDRFIQADIEDKNAYEGSGLGLSISKAYVEMLDGEIWVESEEGVGSQFYFTLPYDQSLNKTKLDATDNIEDTPGVFVKPLKILIAEDEPDSFLYLKILLEDISNKIIHAKTGVEAIEYCKNEQDINLILMDTRMPKTDGIEATHEIRKFNENVIIIAQTAYAMSGDREKMVASGCNDYISKPIDRNELLNMIRKHIK